MSERLAIVTKEVEAAVMAREDAVAAIGALQEEVTALREASTAHTSALNTLRTEHQSSLIPCVMLMMR